MCECNVEQSCVECADAIYGQGEVENHDAEREALNAAGSDFYIAGWTPDNGDDDDWDCACNICAEAVKWYNN